MTETKHTPGPWHTDSDGDGKEFAIVTSTHKASGPDDDVCEVYGGNSDDDAIRQANARLIAAAPDLLAACEAAAACQSLNSCRGLILAAIAKATACPKEDSGRPVDELDDRDPRNPVDMSADDWRDVYSRMDDPDDFIDRDESMNY